MKKIIFTTLLASSLVLASGSDTIKDELVTHVEFGYVNTQGNTDTNAFSLALKEEKAWGKHSVNLLFDGQYASDNNVESKNKYFTELSYDYKLTEKSEFDYLIGYKQDKFSGYSYQSYTGPGGKYKAIKTKHHSLSLEGNILYSQDETEDISYDSAGNTIAYPNANHIATARKVNGSTRNYFAYRAKTVYKWQILENLKFSQVLSYRSEVEDSTNYFVFSKTAIINKITDVFSAGINYKVDYVNLAGSDKERADRTFTANLIVDF